MKTYKYQLHTHTTPCSLCAGMTPKELIRGLLEGGYQGCVLTNHFMHGNTGIDRDLPWEEFVKQYELDYLACLDAARGYDLDIIFGVEEVVVAGLEILCYGVTPQMLYDHPELRDGDCRTWYEVMHSYGVLCIQAHPYRERWYIQNPGMLPLDCIDGIEVYNAQNGDEDNEKAEDFAKEHPDMILTAGADAHAGVDVCVSGIETDRRIRDGRELVDVLKGGEYRLIY